MQRITRDVARRTLVDIVNNDRIHKDITDTRKDRRTIREWDNLLEGSLSATPSQIKIEYLEGAADYRKYKRGIIRLGANENDFADGVSVTQNLCLNRELVAKMLKKQEPK